MAPPGCASWLSCRPNPTDLQPTRPRIIATLPSESLGAYVISMTRTTSDILTVTLAMGWSNGDDWLIHIILIRVIDWLYHNSNTDSYHDNMMILIISWWGDEVHELHSISFFISSSFLVLLVSLMITDHGHGVMAGMSPGVFAAETGRREEVYAGGSIVWNTRGPDQRAKGHGRCPQCPMVQKPHPGEAGGATGGMSWGTLEVESYPLVNVYIAMENHHL